MKDDLAALAATATATATAMATAHQGISSSSGAVAVQPAAVAAATGAGTLAMVPAEAAGLQAAGEGQGRAVEQVAEAASVGGCGCRALHAVTADHHGRGPTSSSAALSSTPLSPPPLPLTHTLSLRLGILINLSVLAVGRQEVARTPGLLASLLQLMRPGMQGQGLVVGREVWPPLDELFLNISMDSVASAHLLEPGTLLQLKQLALGTVREEQVLEEAERLAAGLREKEREQEQGRGQEAVAWLPLPSDADRR